jgi:serine/threonine protein kinase
LLGLQAEAPSRKELELFLKEVQTLAKLHHRNIVQFYGACLETGSMFFVTELMKVGA